MLGEMQNKTAPEDLIRSFGKKVAELKASIAQNPPDDDVAESLAGAHESLRRGEISEQMLVEFVLDDEKAFSASGYMAAMTLARWSRRPDVVLPYLRRIIEWFFDSSLPNDCHDMMREIFAAMALYGRVRSLGFDEDNGVMTSLMFHDLGEQQDDSHRLSWTPRRPTSLPDGD